MLYNVLRNNRRGWHSSLLKLLQKLPSSNLHGSHFKTLAPILLAHDYDDDDLLDLCICIYIIKGSIDLLYGEDCLSKIGTIHQSFQHKFSLIKRALFNPIKALKCKIRAFKRNIASINLWKIYTLQIHKTKNANCLKECTCANGYYTISSVLYSIGYSSFLGLFTVPTAIL